MKVQYNVIILIKKEGICITDFIRDIIIGLSSAIFTVTISEWIKQKGKLNITADITRIEYHSIDESGFNIITENYRETAHSVEVFIKADIYNSSQCNKIMKKITIDAITNDSKRISKKTKDLETERFVARSYRYDDVANQNISPKETSVLKLMVIYDLKTFKEINKFEIVYLNEKNKQKSIKINLLKNE